MNTHQRDFPDALRYHCTPEEYRKALMRNALIGRNLVRWIVGANLAFWCLAGLAAIGWGS